MGDEANNISDGLRVSAGNSSDYRTIYDGTNKCLSPIVFGFVTITV